MSARILCVDDEPALLEILQTLLELANFKVDIANNGREGLDKALKGSYDLILSDIRMPFMTGVEMTTAIVREMDRAHRPKIILMTGYADYTEAEVQEAGAELLLLKPSDVPNITRVIAEVLQRSAH